MAFLGKTFDARLVTAGDDGYLYQLLSGRTDFMLSVNGGNPFTITNNVLSIAQCFMLIAGRVIRVEAGTTISLGTIPSSATNGRVIIRLDMSKNATISGLWQIETEVETIASGGSYRALTQGNINSIVGQTVNKYEVVMCEFTCSSGTASAPVRVLAPNVQWFPLYEYTDSGGALDIPTISTIYNNYAKRCSISAVLGSSRFWLELFYSSANFGLVVAYHSVNPPLSKVFALRNGTWTDMGTLFDTGCIRINYTSEALTGLSAKQIKVGSSETMSGISFGTASAGSTYITLPAGRYRMHTHFATSVGANGYIKSCLKIGSTSTTFVQADKFYAGAGAGTSSTILGANATDILKLTAQSNIYFLVMSSGATEGFNATLTIERLE